MARLGALLFLIAAVSARMLKDPALLRIFEQKQHDLGVLASAQKNCTNDGWITVVNGTTYPWKTFNFSSKIDHFSYRNTDKFNMRYFISKCYYKDGGPIFFYTGNEGDLEDFATNTGIMWDLAPQFNATIIFAEHRFYGKSQPFGDKSYSSLANLGYLTAEQALGDYADFLIALKGGVPNNNTLPYVYSSDTPVIAFGGSYGGMLAAWMRMKYPHLISGAWASSAPLLYVTDGGIPIGSFDNIATRTFTDSGCNSYITYHWWEAIIRLSRTAEGATWLNENMNIDKRSLIVNSTGGAYLNNYIREGFEYMAMVDYPYSTSFLKPMPGSPVIVACKYMNTPGTNFTDKHLATMAYQASQVYYNNNGTGPNTPYCIDPAVCGDQGTAGLGDTMGWPWQECSEIIMIMASTGAPNDMFWNDTNGQYGDLVNTLASQCSQTFGNLNWTTDYWNLKAVETRFGLSLAGHSRLILTQGYLDPWSGGGYSTNSSGVDQKAGIYVQQIQGSAHHLDLRTPNTCDPNTITNMRLQIVDILKAWIQGSDNPTLKSLPVWNRSNLNMTQCADVLFGYPWPSNNTDTTTQSSVTTTTQKSAFSVLSYLGVVTALLQAF